MRVPNIQHRLSEVINLGRREAAVLCILMLRGPQTAGELRGPHRAAVSISTIWKRWMPA